MKKSARQVKILGPFANEADTMLSAVSLKEQYDA